jgi:hypothetical protein
VSDNKSQPTPSMNRDAMDLVERLTSEGLIGVAQAARLVGTFRNDKPTHPSTISRWMLSGFGLPGGRIIKLEHIKIAGRLATSKPALLRYLAAQQTDTNDGVVIPASRSPAARRRASEDAGAELEKRGV